MEWFVLGLVNINSNSNSKIECTINFTDTVHLYDNVNIGDYISYTPTRTSYTISASQTGCTNTSTCGGIDADGNQIINPNELNLWRVIRKNANGTIEIVSENVSSTVVYFYGGKGYVNFIGGLNTIASSYETEGITSGSRHMGYSNQIEYCSSLSNCSDDTAYSSDTNLVTSAIGFLEAMPIKSNTNASYWIASRYIYAGNNNYRGGRFIGNDGEINKAFYDLVIIGINEFAGNQRIRPIVILKSGITGVKGTYNNKNLWKVN